MTSTQRSAILGVGMLSLLSACASPPPSPAPAPGPVSATPAVRPIPAAPADVNGVTREAPPPALPARPMEFPPFEESALPNGLSVIVVEKHTQPVVNANLFVRTGSAADPANKAGLATLMADVLTKGTPTRTAKEIATTIEGVGGSISSSATDDYVVISADVLREQLPLALELLSDVSLHPTFPAGELETARTQMLSALQVSLSQPADVAQRRFAKELYGANHPYSMAPLPATVSAIRRADLTGFHDRYFRADNALLVVSGDVSTAEVQELARRYFGGWKGGGAPAVDFVDPPARDSTTLYLVNRPGSVQSNILVGDIAIRPDNPDYYPLQVMNQVIGGGTDSRLFTILREQKGWTYGAYSQVTRPIDVGFFMASAEVRTAVTDSALTEMLHQLRRARDEELSAAELNAAKSFLIGSFPLRIETAAQIASQVARNRLLGLPAEEVLRYREKIQAVTAADVQRVAREYVRPDQAVIVVVGEAAQLYPKLQGIAPIVLSDVEGKPMQPGDLTVKASASRYDASRLAPTTLTYQVLMQGNAIGTATTALTKEGEAWVATQKVAAAGATQDSEVRFDDAFTPISSRQAAAQGPVQMEIITRFEGGKVTGTAKLPAQMGGDKPIDADVPAGTVFSGMDQWILATVELQPGKEITIPVFNGQSGTPANAVYTVGAAESVKVPAGTFATNKVSATVVGQQITLWVRQEAPHIVVKQEMAGQPISIELQSVK
jgi:zinc protease